MKEKFFLTPLGRRILIEPDEFIHKGLIQIPDRLKMKTTTGVILAFGEPHDVLKIGDRILYDRFAGSEVGFEPSEPGTPDRHYRMVGFDEVIAKINDQSNLKE